MAQEIGWPAFRMTVGYARKDSPTCDEDGERRTSFVLFKSNERRKAGACLHRLVGIHPLTPERSVRERSAPTELNFDGPDLPAKWSAIWLTVKSLSERSTKRPRCSSFG